MIWIVLGVMVTSLIYPLHLGVTYYLTVLESARGQTTAEKADHYQNSLTALGRLFLIVGLAMCAWGAVDEFVPDKYIENRIQQDKEMKVTHVYPGGGMVP